MVVAEASGVAEVVTVAGNSVEAAMVVAIAGTGLSVEEVVGTDVAVVWVHWAVEFVVGGTVAVVAV